MTGVLFPGNYGVAPVAPAQVMEEAVYPAPPSAPPRVRVIKWPSKEHLEYTKEFITTSLLILALPWILRFLFKNPPAFAKSLSSVTP